MKVIRVACAAISGVLIASVSACGGAQESGQSSSSSTQSAARTAPLSSANLCREMNRIVGSAADKILGAENGSPAFFKAYSDAGRSLRELALQAQDQRASAAISRLGDDYLKMGTESTMMEGMSLMGSDLSPAIAAVCKG